MNRYFSEKEVEGLSQKLIKMLVYAREIYGYPIVITSGYRDPAKNADAGGVRDSAHTTGLAVDLRANSRLTHNRLLWALTVAGFKRIGDYNLHIHADIDESKPTPAYWTGESK